MKNFNDLVRLKVWEFLFFVNSVIEELFWKLGLFFEDKLFTATKDVESNEVKKDKK